MTGGGNDHFAYIYYFSLITWAYLNCEPMLLRKRIAFALTLGCLSLLTNVSAQNVSVGFSGLEEYYRRAQLLGNVDSTFSFLARPFDAVSTLDLVDPFDPAGNLDTSSWNSWNGEFSFFKGKVLIQALPIIQQTAYKAPVPISMNDGPMLPARGFQSLLSGGFYAKVGPLSIRLQPEFFVAENKPYNGFVSTHSNLAWRAFYHTHNFIDLPEQFGDKPAGSNTLGQSNIKLNFGPISFGVSNENLWWGPGTNNSLLMTNSAPGFKHFVVNSNKPIKTGIGNFEGQLIAGKLESSGYRATQNPLAEVYEAPKHTDWRYINGLVVTYMPKWTPGLFLGASRAVQFYSENLKAGIGNYLPVILPMQEARTDVDLENNAGRDQLASIFVRWILLKEKAEIYFEYGREDRSYDFRDLLLDFTHSRAYLFGMKKIIPLKSTKNQNIELSFEMTQLEGLRTSRSITGTYDTSWYTHGSIRHGYTHSGQMLGAGIGPGSNMQTLGITWFKGIKSIGFQLDRYVHNNDLLHNAELDTRHHWIDIIPSGIVSWDIKNLIIRAKLSGVRSYNYQWHYSPGSTPEEVSDPWAHGKMVHSVQGFVGVAYRF